jgi:hypothetical protein
MPNDIKHSNTQIENQQDSKQKGHPLEKNEEFWTAKSLIEMYFTLKFSIREVLPTFLTLRLAQ